MDRYMQAPLDKEEVKALEAGDYVYITGTIYTARDAAHLRMSEALDRGEELPIDLNNNIIYYLYNNILFDFARSRRALAQFNPHVLYLSYPFGGFNDKAVKAAKEAGFHLAVTTMKGKVKPGDNPLLLKRLYILRTDSLETMSRLVSNQPQG